MLIDPAGVAGGGLSRMRSSVVLKAAVEVFRFFMFCN